MRMMEKPDTVRSAICSRTERDVTGTREEYIARLHVALLSAVPLPAAGYGGTERVIAWLARALAEAGHTVTLLAPPGSSLPQAATRPVAWPAGRERDLDYRPFLPPGVDVVHAHHPQRRFGELPFLWTLHGNAGDPETLLPHAVALSADHARRHRLASWVHNGLDPDEYAFAAVKRGDDLFLGRLHSVKGWRWAVEGARRAGRPLTVAGGWRPSLRPGLRFLRSVDGARKAALLAEAPCLWAPAQWEEPFGLTTIEAMVSGTPVLGTPRGALPELLGEVGGAMGATLEDLIAARPALDGADAEAIRARVLAHFTHRTMGAAYEVRYREAIGRG